MFWIGFDWDWVTGDGTDAAPEWVRCKRNCRHCKSHGVKFGRGVTDPEDCSWQGRLEQVEALLSRVELTGVAEYRDSHASIIPLLGPGDKVWHIDEHEDWGIDSFYREDPLCSQTHSLAADASDLEALQFMQNLVKDRTYHLPYVMTCGNWRQFATYLRVETYDVQPDQVPDGTYRLFVCRSAPYTPKHLDGELAALLASLPIPVNTDLQK